MDQLTFADLSLSPKVYEAVAAAGYTTPTPIQAQAIPVAVTGRDVLGIAQTGTGKTASFTLPMITRLEQGRARARMPRSLILAPTRELAAQVAQAFEKYGVNHKLTVALLIGGVSFVEQNKALDRGVDVLIATPGRMIDHFQRGKLLLNGVEILVIDEADRMLDMGFIPDIEKICNLLPKKRQTLFFSATMPPEITRLVSQFLTDPVRIEVAPPATTAKTITQRFYFFRDDEDWAKREMLRELIRAHEVRNAIIFCNRKRDVAILQKSLTKHGFNAGALHGDMDQKSRMETLDGFRSGEITFLAASDVAARGLDIPDVSHIFNFDVPWAGDDYVHRIGRTGRAGKEGFSATLVGPDDLKLIKDIEKINGEPCAWEGEAPTEDDYANSGKRRRGRGGRTAGAAKDRGSDRPRRGAASRGEQAGSGESTDVATPEVVNAESAEGGERQPRSRDGRRRRSRGGRGNEQEQNAAVKAETPDSVEAIETLQDAPEPRPRRRRGGRSQEGDAQQPQPVQPRKAGSGQQDDKARGKADRGGARRRGGNDTGGPNAFHGDSIPAFLQRPVRKEKPEPQPSSKADVGADDPVS